VDRFQKESHLYDAWIGANYIACDKEIRAAGNPFAICAIDTDFFAPTASASRMWEGTFALLRATNCVLVTYIQYAPFIEQNFPVEIRNKTCYLKTLGASSGRIRTVFKWDEMHVTSYGNVLPDVMLPIASALSQSVVIYGCDGSPPTHATNFPKSDKYQMYDDEQIKEAVKNDKPVWDALTYQKYFNKNSLYTRFVVDECRRNGTMLSLRCPSWNSGLSGLPLLDESC
jgi:hypothetical protein